MYHRSSPVIKTFLFFIIAKILFFASPAKAQSRDTLSLTVEMTEKIFLEHNLRLLIEHYGIERAEAELQTAKLIANPTFSFGNGIYTKTRDSNALSQQTYSISQLLLTAQKRKTGIEMAKINIQKNHYAFYEVLRELRYSLRSNFYSLSSARQCTALYQQELLELEKTLGAFRILYKKGNISKREVLRIESLIYTLESEQGALITKANELQEELKLLMNIRDGSVIRPIPGKGYPIIAKLSSIPFKMMLDSALINRKDLKLAGADVDYSVLNAKLQKSMAYPDITLSINYDKKAGYGQRYLSGGLAFAIPVFNRNQGNRRLAELMVGQKKLEKNQLTFKLESELSLCYDEALRLEKIYQGIDQGFRNDYDILIREVYRNYEKRNISLVEFLDLYSSYRTNFIQMNNLDLQRIIALEKLNYVTSSHFF